MRVRQVVSAGIVCAGIGALVVLSDAEGQQAAPGRGAAAQVAPNRVHGNLVQVMRGILYPASNVIFAAQTDDPAAVKPAGDPATSPNPLTSVYGGWTAVENAGIAIAEGANLLTIPGRMCGNGRPAPVQNADWQKWVEELRAAGMSAYKAAQSKNQDNILEAAGAVSEACQHCHDKYREVPTRC